MGCGFPAPPGNRDEGALVGPVADDGVASRLAVGVGSAVEVGVATPPGVGAAEARAAAGAEVGGGVAPPVITNGGGADVGAGTGVLGGGILGEPLP